MRFISEAQLHPEYPLPDTTDPIMRPFWEGARAGKLMQQRDRATGDVIWPPKPLYWKGGQRLEFGALYAPRKFSFGTTSPTTANFTVIANGYEFPALLRLHMGRTLSFGFGGYYDGGWGPYDPWYGGYPSAGGYTGSIRLKVKPRNAAVYVDGFFVGLVDEFDGIFQRLPIEPGAYTIEIRADGYEPHTFDVRVVPDRTTTYEAELTPIR